MSDALDELRAELASVEPSRAFARETLARLERERARAPRRAWLFLMPMTAAAIVIAIARSGGGVGTHSALPKAVIASKPAETMARPTAAEPPVRRSSRARPADATWTIPENAHADQAIAVRQLMTLIRAGKAQVPPDSIVLDDSGPVPMLPPVELKPIVIAPLPMGQGGGSER
jgi:hypothetical protein